MHGAILLALLAVAATPAAAQATFYDDFNDNYIGDWDQRCLSGSWGASGGFATVSTGNSCSALVCPGQITGDDVTITISGTATHVFGVVARLDGGDNGLYAYVSPDHDVARIRQVSSGAASTILNSLNASFPSGVTYELTFTCNGQDLSLEIDVPSTGQQWILNAVDPSPESGEFGLASGDEALASFDWVDCTYGTLPEMDLESIATDDDMQGQSAGDGDGAFEAGEQIELNLGVGNSGDAPVTNVLGLLQSLNSSIVVVDNYVTYGTIQPGQIGLGQGSFVINAQPFAAMPATYPMRLTVLADGGFSQQYDFDIPLGNGITCDVETGYSSWTNTALQGGWNNNWHVSTTRNHTSGGLRSFKCGNTSAGDYSDHLFCGEMSPWFNVPHNGALTFWMWTDAQTYSIDAPLALDGGLIQIGQFDNWDTPVPVGGYPYEIASSPTGPFAAGSGVFSGSYGWQLVTYPFTEDQTGPQRLRFVFGSDNAGTREGWYIDDIQVTGPTGIDPGGSSGDLMPLSVTASPNPFSDMTLLELQGTNAGQTEIVIFDLSGRIVRELSPTTAAGTWVTVWDGRGSEGQHIPPGFYVARCSNPAGEVQSVRLIKTE